MSGPWEDFQERGPWEDFGGASAPKIAKPAAIGKDANERFLREEMQNADPFTRNLAGFGVAASDTWEGLKQWFGQGDKERIAANKVIADEAPAAALVGDVAMTSIPFLGAPGATVKTAAKIGAAYGATRPVEGEGYDEMLLNKGKAIALDAGLMATGQKGADVVGKLFARKEGRLAADQSRNAQRDQTLREAQEMGFVAPPSSVNPSWWNTLKESVGGKIATAQSASNNNAPLFERAVRRDLGLVDDATLTPEALQTARDRAYAVGYKPVADIPEIGADPKFVDDIGRLMPGRAGGAIKSPGHAEIGELIGTLQTRGRWSGEQLIQDIRQLRENADVHFRGSSSEKDLARAEKQAAKYLEDMAERGIQRMGGDPNAVQLFREAREYIAKTFTAGKSVNPATGAVDPASWAKRVKDGKPMGGEMEKAAKFALAFPKASQPAAKIAGPAVSKLNSAMSLIGGGGGFAAGGPALAAVMGAAPFVVPPLVRRQMLGKRAQQNVLRDLYQLSLPERMTRRLVKHAPVGFAVSGSNAFLE